MQDWQVYKQEAEPVAELMKLINDGYRVAYEFDKDDYREGNPFIEEGKGAPREKWGIDLSKIAPNTTGGHLHWGNKIEQLREHILYFVVSQAVENQKELQTFFRDREEDLQDHYRNAYRNLTNAWRDEYALASPIGASSEERTNVAEWKIIQAYYCVYKATSALLRCKYSNIRTSRGGSHTSMWEFHRINSMDTLESKLYAFPFLYFPNDDNPRSNDYFNWIVPYPINEEFEIDQANTQDKYVENSLSNIYEKAKQIPYFENKNMITFYDLLQWLREWAQYQRGGIFSRLYGTTHIKAIDDALRLVAYTGIAIAEVAFICSFGLHKFYYIYKQYRESCEAGNVLDSQYFVSNRYDVYSNALSDFT